MDTAKIESMFEGVRDIIGMLQIREEIVWAIERIDKYLGDQNNTILELGCFWGGSLSMLSLLTSPDNALIIGVDPELHGANLKLDQVQQISNRPVVGIKASSIEKETADNVVALLGGRKIDILSIDSVHTASHAEKEFALYSPLMNSPSVIMFHDISTGYLRNEQFAGYTGFPQIPIGEFWNSIKFRYSYEEKKITGGYPNYGIGLLYIE